MNIALYTQWFPPEQAPIGYMYREIAEALLEEEHSVTIYTAFPNHPKGEIFEGYSNKLISNNFALNGLKTTRTWIHTNKKRSTLNRIFAFATFTLSSHLALLFDKKTQIVVNPMQPLSNAITLAVLCKLTNKRLIFNIQDLHPDALIALGLIKNKLAIKILRLVELLGYQLADSIITICEPFKTHCIQRGANRNRVSVIQNWVNENEIFPTEDSNSIRAKAGLNSDDFIILYAGTVGEASGVEFILEIAKEIKNPNIKFLIVGDGTKADSIKSRIISEQISSVKILPFQPRENVNEVQNTANLSIILQKDTAAAYSVPSKLLAYFAAAKPVICISDKDTESARLIKDANNGYTICEKAPCSIASEIEKLSFEREKLKHLGNNGRKYLINNLSKSHIIRKYIEHITKTEELNKIV